MSEQELPPVGSRVRVTYEGTVTAFGETGVIVRSDRGWHLACEISQMSAIEILAPSAPPEPEGDVVVMGGGRLWKKDAPDAHYWWSTGFRGRGWAELVKDFGPIKIYRPEES